MNNYDGTAKAILQRKTQDLVACLSKQYNTEKIIVMLKNIAESNDNPAYQAAMITALKSADTIEKIKEEIQNPSFEIPSVDEIPLTDIPAKYTKSYQPSQVFIKNTDEATVPTGSIKQAFNSITVKKDQEIVANLKIKFDI